MTRARIYLASCLILGTLVCAANTYGQAIRISDDNRVRTPNVKPIPSTPEKISRLSSAQPSTRQNSLVQFEEDASAPQPSFSGNPADASPASAVPQPAVGQFEPGNTGNPAVPTILTGQQTREAGEPLPAAQPARPTATVPQLGPPQIQSEPVYRDQAAPQLNATQNSANQGFVPPRQLAQPESAPSNDFSAAAQPQPNSQPISNEVAPQNEQPLQGEFPAIPRRQETVRQETVPASQYNSFAPEQPLQQVDKTELARSQTDQISLRSNSPQVAVTTTGPKSVSINKSALYKVNVANIGSLPTGSILVAVDIPGHVELADADHSAGTPEVEQGEMSTRVLWTIPNVAARAQESILLKLVPRQPITFDLGVEWTFVPFAAAGRVQVTEPKLAMDISGPSDVKYGEKAIYTITLHNPGTGAAENVVVMLSETLGGEQAAVGTVGPGDRKQFEVELIARDAGVIELGATVKADNGLSVDAAKKITVRRGKLEVAATAPQFKYAGSEITYEVVIANVGDAAAANVIAAVALPVGAQYLGGIQGGTLSEGGDGLRWPVGTLTPGSERSYTIQCLLTAAGSAKLEAGARADDELAAAASAITKVDALADLTLIVKDPRGPQLVGEEIVYEIQVSNRGTKEATNVKLIGQFSPGIEPTRTEGLSSKIVPGSVVFDIIPAIPVGQQVVVKVHAKAEVNGTHTFRTELNCSDQDIRRSSEGTTKFFTAPEGNPAGTDRLSNGAVGGEFPR